MDRISFTRNVGFALRSHHFFFPDKFLGAEVLYQTAREFIGDALPSGTDADIAEHGKIVFDLYSGTWNDRTDAFSGSKKSDRCGDH